MYHCDRCGVRFNRGVLSGMSDCPRCKARDGVSVHLRWEKTKPTPGQTTVSRAALTNVRRAMERLERTNGPALRH